MQQCDLSWPNATQKPGTLPRQRAERSRYKARARSVAQRNRRKSAGGRPKGRTRTGVTSCGAAAAPGSRSSTTTPAFGGGASAGADTRGAPQRAIPDHAASAATAAATYTALIMPRMTFDMRSAKSPDSFVVRGALGSRAKRFLRERANSAKRLWRVRESRSRMAERASESTERRSLRAPGRFLSAVTDAGSTPSIAAVRHCSAGPVLVTGWAAAPAAGPVAGA